MSSSDGTGVHKDLDHGRDIRVEGQVTMHGMSDLKDEVHDELAWSRIRYALREPFAEFFGTFIILMFGDGSVAQVVLSNGEKGGYQSITWGWGYVNSVFFPPFLLPFSPFSPFSPSSLTCPVSASC